MIYLTHELRLHIQEEELRRQLKKMELGLDGWLSMLKQICSSRIWNETHRRWEYIQQAP